jgi:curved DNA-binding protein CbpA
MEAYQVLSKAHSRANYDQSLKGIHSVNYVNRDIFYEPYKAESTSYTADKPYYGVKGIKKLSNWKIVMACVAFCALGIVIQTIAISRTNAFRREIMKERSAIYSDNLRKAREDADKYGNAEQLQRLKLRLKNSPYDEVKPEV